MCSEFIGQGSRLLSTQDNIKLDLKENPRYDTPETVCVCLSHGQASRHSTFNCLGRIIT
jgi:hypothetical protein